MMTELFTAVVLFYANLAESRQNEETAREPAANCQIEGIYGTNIESYEHNKTINRVKRMAGQRCDLVGLSGWFSMDKSG